MLFAVPSLARVELFDCLLPGTEPARCLARARHVGAGCCMTLRDTLASVNRCFLSFPDFWPVTEKARASLVFYL